MENSELMPVMQAVQESGETNMFNRGEVARVAGRLGYIRALGEQAHMTVARYTELLVAFDAWLAEQDEAEEARDG